MLETLYAVFLLQAKYLEILFSAAINNQPYHRTRIVIGHLSGFVTVITNLQRPYYLKLNPPHPSAILYIYATETHFLTADVSTVYLWTIAAPTNPVVLYIDLPITAIILTPTHIVVATTENLKFYLREPFYTLTTFNLPTTHLQLIGDTVISTTQSFIHVHTSNLQIQSHTHSAITNLTTTADSLVIVTDALGATIYKLAPNLIALRRITQHAITAVYMDAWKLVVLGSELRVFDTINMSVLRKLSARGTCLQAGRDWIVVHGHHGVQVWWFGVSGVRGKVKQTSMRNKVSRKGRINVDDDDEDLKDEWRDKRWEKAVDCLGLDEEELLHYVMMMSREESGVEDIFGSNDNIGSVLTSLGSSSTSEKAWDWDVDELETTKSVSYSSIGSTPREDDMSWLARSVEDKFVVHGSPASASRKSNINRDDDDDMLMALERSLLEM
ncbi:hypothetical protein HK096_003313 [Nowakowskiella sp. JEL0078]|nr:hypothetical protein HK096_003313 [Nowakowskiella sp. JEL0078]